MTSQTSNFRGIAAMLFSTGSFVVADSFLKLALAALPPFEALFLRGVAATIGCLGLLLALGQGRTIRSSFQRHVLLRGLLETAATLCYVVALSRMLLADVIAIVQTAPLLLIVLIALFGRERIGSTRMALAVLGFAGALAVAQPGGDGPAEGFLLAFACAAGVAIRDLVGRRVPAETPVLAVIVSTVVVVMAGAGVAMALVETPVRPSPADALNLVAAGLFVSLGHFGLFMAYRLGAPAVVAPFFYSFALWAVLAGLVVFGELPNPMALAGIAIIVASGLGLILLDRRSRRSPAPA